MGKLGSTYAPLFDPRYHLFKAGITAITFYYMNFSEALIAIKAYKKVAREGWNGKGMWVSLQEPDPNSYMTRPYVFMTLPAGSTKQFGETAALHENRVPWLCSQTDLLAEDWVEIA